MKTFVILVGIVAVAAACSGRKTELTPEPGSGSPPVVVPAGSGSAKPEPVPVADADFITVVVSHHKKKADDPALVHFKKYAVTKANIDAAKIEGSTATIELDASSVSSGKVGRDEHIVKADYLDVAQFAKIVIDIDNVKLKDGKVYTADAKVQAIGNEKKYPVTFEVLDAKADWIKIKAEHTFSRLDFKIGRDPEKDKGESVAAEMTIKMQVTLKKP